MEQVSKRKLGRKLEWGGGWGKHTRRQLAVFTPMVGVVRAMQAWVHACVTVQTKKRMRTHRRKRACEARAHGARRQLAVFTLP
jgi:hypothetical protein